MDFNLSRIARNMTRNLFGTDIIANNLANISTTGFKRDAAFTDWFTEALDQGALKGYTNFSQGEMLRTENPLDMAITSSGFFVIQTDSGVAFTRAGHFLANSDGLLETQSGHLVLGEHGPISVTDEDGTLGLVEVSRQGEVYVDGLLADNLAIANIPNLHTMRKLGNNLFIAQNDMLVDQMEPELIDIRQGMLEGSNVMPVLEMVTLIDLQRNYESTQRVAKAMDQILGRATQLADYR